MESHQTGKGKGKGKEGRSVRVKMGIERKKDT